MDGKKYSNRTLKGHAAQLALFPNFEQLFLTRKFRGGGVKHNFLVQVTNHKSMKPTYEQISGTSSELSQKKELTGALIQLYLQGARLLQMVSR